MDVMSTGDRRKETVVSSFNRRIFFLLLLLLCSNFLFAQRKYSSSNPKAIKAFENALKCLDGKYYDKAFEYLDDAIKADPTFADVYILRANMYEEQQKYDQAIQAFKESFRINPDYFPNSYYTLGKIELRIAQYDSAKVHFEKFLSYKDIRPELSSRAEQFLNNAQFATDAVKHPVPFSPVNMGDSINSPDEEYFPAITGDGKTFLFTRRLKSKDQSGIMHEQEDFFVSNYVKDHWSSAHPLTEINTKGNEGAPALSADGQYLFFVACEEPGSGYPGNRKGKGSCDVFISKRVGDKFREPRNLEAPVNTVYGKVNLLFLQMEEHFILSVLQEARREKATVIFM
jgi:tetratricopeptide (TPR) repeat protein